MSNAAVAAFESPTPVQLTFLIKKVRKRYFYRLPVRIVHVSVSDTFCINSFKRYKARRLSLSPEIREMDNFMLERSLGTCSVQ